MSAERNKRLYHYNDAPFQSPPFDHSHSLDQPAVRLPGLGLKLPASQSQRLRRSFDNLKSGGVSDSTEDGGISPDAMDSFDDLPPDYGDDDNDGPTNPLPSQQYPHHNPAPQDVADLSTLPSLTEEAVLDVVKERYQRNKIFTRCGDVLVSVNPFKSLPIFDDEAHEHFTIDRLGKSPEPEPHLFWVAAHAISRRSRDKENQVVLVSGESGAGKTEATKLMLRHILHLSTSKMDRMYDSLDKVNPLIELFGNARTQLNGNSSRFAKFLEVKFSKEGEVNGATIRDYILEKSRVVKPSEKESNFHIFYTFLDDVMRSPERQSQFLMEGMDKYTDFRIVPRGSWRRAEHRMTTEDQAYAFKRIGVGSLEVENMHVVLAAILHLTNIRFEEDDSSAGGVMVENEETMRKAAALLNVDPEHLTRALVTKRGKFSGDEIEMFKSQAKAEETRDAMAKALYERLFGWLIRTINMALSRRSSSEACIGFLDICGFEDLQQNGLEQLCINLANEHLQKFMNSQVFQHELEIYRQEGINLGDIQPPTNEAILQMFDAPKVGILALINEDTRVEISTNASLVQKLCQRHAQSEHFTPYKKSGQPRFGISHFAAPVWYDADHFLEKNGDDLGQEVKDLLVSSSNELVSDLIQAPKADTGSISPSNYDYRVSRKHSVTFQHPGQTRLSETLIKGLRQSLSDRFHGHVPPSVKHTGRSKMTDQRTVIDCFQASMKELLDKMKKAHPLFVRCIKPNNLQVPEQFEDRKVRLQLRYNGMTEIARIRKSWFPVRLPCNDFIVKYCELSPEAKTKADKREVMSLILRQVRAAPEDVRFGRNLIFLKDPAAISLDKALEKLEAEKERKRKEEERKRKEEDRKRKEAEKRKAEAEVKPTKLGSILDTRGPNSNKLDTVMEESTPDTSRRTSATPTSSSNPSTASSATSIPSTTDGGRETGGASAAAAKEEEVVETKNLFWDIFRIVAREKDRTDIHRMTTMKVIKFLAYIIIFLIVLASATAQKVSLMVMVSAMKVNKNSNKDDLAVSTAYYILMMVAVCIPYMLTLLVSLAKVAFGGFRNPSLGTWVWVFVMESLHTLGLTLMVFRILPKLDVVHGLLFMNAVGLFPSILKIVTSVDVNSGVPTSSRYRIVKRVTRGVMDFLAFAGQVSVLPIVYVIGYVTTNDDGVWSILDVAGVMFVSVAWWENFMDGRFFVKLRRMNPLKNFMLQRRFDLERGRYIPQLVMSVWKIVLTALLAYFYRGERYFDYEKAFDTLGRFHNEWKLITSIIVLTLSALACYYFAYIACKLWMQRLSFGVPLMLATPLAVVVFFLNNEYHFLTSVTETHVTGDVVITWPDDPRPHWRTLTAGLAWFISLLLLTRHVWSPRQNRLAKFEMMFMNPMYCGIATTEALLLNRRRHTLSTRKKREGEDRCYYRMDDSEARTGEGHPDYVDETYAEIGPSGETYDPEAGGPRGESYGGEGALDEEVPMIYACATMWHEVRREMVALLKSLHRIDLEQWTRKQAQELSGTRDKDYFEYEAHIFFDDAMTLNDDEEFIPNDYVKMVVDVMEEAVSSVYKKTMTVKPPLKIPTPYGGQLLWIMPGDNLLFIHLKDKTKIRHRKRWSQVMYMYYLLGFRLTRQCQQQIIEALKAGQVDDNAGWAINRDDVVGSDIFEMLDDKVARKSQNTFVMALDGDTDFSPGSVHILLDRMKKNPKVGAACGRIHPIGSGPLVWYQMFEYAIGHWMQKATEHVLGCVLCSPGCFSLFRGSALMDDNVMRKYAILPTEPGHFLQYDQGEDRWLCTLLLQQGYRVDYAAAADAWTYAPEGFNEFFNQRRRWMPSTLANVMDLLADYSNTVAVNSNISMLYIAYQVALMVATLLGPGTVLMMIAGAIGVVFSVNLIWSYVITMVPAIIYLVVCMKCKTNIQLYLAAILSTFYAFVMMIVFVGVIVTAARESIFHPSVLVIICLIIIFVIAGLCHPMEMYCLPSGALYLLCIPSGYLLLVIYSLCNLHVVSWGTREGPKKKTKAELEQEKLDAEQKQKEKAQKKGFFSRFFFSSYLNDLKELILSATSQQNKVVQEDESLKLLQQINENLQKLTDCKTGKGGAKKDASAAALEQVKVVVEEMKKDKPVAKQSVKEKKSVTIDPEPVKERVIRNELENPRWIEDQDLGEGDVMKLFDEELVFWKGFIKKYLKPLDADKEKEKEMMEKLLELRTQVCFGFSMINLLWIAINFMFQYTEAVPVTLPIDEGVEVGILGLLFIIFLLLILLLQIFGMIVHRWGTLLHLLAFTDIDLPCFSKKRGSMRGQKEKDFQRAFAFCQRLISEPVPDYLEDNGQLGVSVRETVAEKLRKTILGNTHAVGTQSVVQNLSQSGVLDREFVKSQAFNLYLRGTKLDKGDEEDQDAQEFVSEFRSNLYERNPSRHRNGYPGRPHSGGFGAPRSPRGDGYAPPPPRRQNSGHHPSGVRRRLAANNLRYTVRDTVERLAQDTGKVIPLGRREPGQYGGGPGGYGMGAGREGGGAGREGGGARRGGGGGGVMDRAFSVRMQMLGEYTRGAGQNYGRNGVRNV